MSEPTIEELRAAKPKELLQPHDESAEKGLICSCIKNPREVIPMCVDKGVRPESFWLPRHVEVYRALVRMWDQNKPIDFITLIGELTDAGTLAAAGGAVYPVELESYLPTAANAGAYIRTVLDKALLRQMDRVGTTFVTKSHEPCEDTAGLLDEFEAAVLNIRSQRKENGIQSSRSLVIKAMESIDAMCAAPGAITGIPTGILEVDEMTGGLQPDDMVVIAARPSHGKSAIAMNAVEHAAVIMHHPCLVFSLEMSAVQLKRRSIASRARVDLFKIRDRGMDNDSRDKLSQSAQEFSKAPIYIDDTRGVTIQDIRAKARRAFNEYGIRLIVVDYLQLVAGTLKRSRDNREQEVAEVSAGLKSLAKELGCPVLALCQLGRDIVRRADGNTIPRPRMSDLRESGAIEQDADIIAFLIRHSMFLEDAEQKESEDQNATLFIEKARNGPIGDIPLNFYKQYCLFTGRDSQGSFHI